MRTKIQLLLMLRHNVDVESDFYGMCSCISIMLCTQIEWKECDILLNYLRKHKPLRAHIRSFLGTDIRYQYWWKIGLKEPRLRWLDRRIKIEIRKQKLKNLFR